MSFLNQNINEIFKSKIIPVLSINISKGKQIIDENIGPTAIDFLEDDEKCDKLFGNLYYIIPQPLQLIVNKEKFKSYCLDNREFIVEIFNKNESDINDEK